MNGDVPSVLLDNILCYGHSKTRACMRRSCICPPVIAIKHFFQLLFFYPFAIVLNYHMSPFFLLHTERVNLVSLLRETLIDMLNDSRYADKSIELQTNLEKLMLNLDAILIRRAVTNLILNALVHNDPDVKIVVRLERSSRTTIFTSGSL